MLLVLVAMLHHNMDLQMLCLDYAHISYKIKCKFFIHVYKDNITLDYEINEIQIFHYDLSIF